MLEPKTSSELNQEFLKTLIQLQKRLRSLPDYTENDFKLIEELARLKYELSQSILKESYETAQKIKERSRFCSETKLRNTNRRVVKLFLTSSKKRRNNGKRKKVPEYWYIRQTPNSSIRHVFHTQIYC